MIIQELIQHFKKDEYLNRFNYLTGNGKDLQDFLNSAVCDENTIFVTLNADTPYNQNENLSFQNSNYEFKLYMTSTFEFDEVVENLNTYINENNKFSFKGNDIFLENGKGSYSQFYAGNVYEKLLLLIEL